MPRVSNLTDAGRKKAAAKTNAIVAERKRKRLEAVRQLHQEGKTPAEIARLLGVHKRTITRDLEAIEASLNDEEGHR